MFCIFLTHVSFKCIQMMLLKMPGISSKNVHAIMNTVEDLAELVTLSESRLAEIMGSEQHARMLHHFLHKQQQGEPLAGNVKPSTSGTKKPLLKGVKRRR